MGLIEATFERLESLVTQLQTLLDTTTPCATTPELGAAEVPARLTASAGCVVGSPVNQCIEAIEAQLRDVRQQSQESEVQRQKLAMAQADAIVHSAEIIQQLQEAQAQIAWLSAIAEHSADAIIGLSLDGRVTAWNGAAVRIFGLESQEALGRPFAALDQVPALACVREPLQIAAPGARLIEIDEAVDRPDGTHIDLSVTVSPVLDHQGQLTGVSLIARDVSDKRRAELALREANRALARQAATDGLTGLANRRAFDEALGSVWRSSQSSKATSSLLMMDVDFFKRFNDVFGHLAGDDCLRAISRTIRGCLCCEREIAARYGGEEFAVILPDSSPARAFQVAERIRQAVRDARIPHSDSPIAPIVSISIGCATFSATQLASPASAVRCADMALYRAKNAGRNRVAVLDLDSACRSESTLSDQRLPACIL